MARIPNRPAPASAPIVATPATMMRPVVELEPERGYLSREMAMLAVVNELTGEEDALVLQNGKARKTPLRYIVALAKETNAPANSNGRIGGGGRHTYERSVARAPAKTPDAADKFLALRDGQAIALSVGDISGGGGGGDTDTLGGQAGSYYLARANHTGTQLAATISDFSEAVDDRAAALIQNGTGITWSYNDGAGTLTPTIVNLTTAQFAANVVDTDVTLAANSNTRIASQAAVKAYADALIAANDAMVFKGVIDASANPNYPAADRGHTYKISVAGKIGGASGPNVEVGDTILCITDGSAAGTHAAVGANWNIVQANLDGAVIGPASVTDDLPAIFDGASGKLIKSKTYAAFKTLLALVKGDVGLGNVDNTSDATKNAAAVALTNKTSYNNVQINAPATLAIFAPAAGKVIAINSSLTFFGTDGSLIDVGGGGTVPYQGGSFEVGHASDSTLARTAAGRLTVEGEELISTKDTSAVLSAAQQRAVRSNIGAAHIAAMAQHNAVINGGMDVSQELGTTGATLTNNTAKYILDMVEGMYNHGAATAVVTSAQLAAASFPSALSGFAFGHQIKATTAITSPANGDFAKHRLKFEGNRVARWGFGAAGASSIVVAFRLYSTGSGTALVRLSNSAGDRFYHHEITVAAGWNFYAFTLAGDTSGTWLATTGIGLVFEVFTSGKETTPGSTLDAWTATGKIQTTNSGNLLGTNNNLTILTGVYIDAGTQLPVAADLPHLMRPFAEEFELCERHFWKIGGASAATPIVHGYNAATAADNRPVLFPRPMRIAPTMAVGSGGGWNVVNCAVPTAVFPDTRGFALRTIVTTTNPFNYFPASSADYITADARL